MSPTSPSPTGGNGRDRSGRFAPGNRIGRGNPHARRVARLRAELLRAVGPEELRAIVEALVAQAKAGDVQAAREVLQRVVGPPEAPRPPGARRAARGTPEALAKRLPMGKTTIARHAMRLGLARFEAATRAQLAELLEALAREEEKHRGDR